MSEVANISEIQENTVPAEQTIVEAETTSIPEPAEVNAETPTATEEQVVNNSIEAEAAAGDAGTSAVEAAKSAESSPKVESKKSPVKRTPSKRMSFIERAQKESEELVKNMGGSLELDGGRRTRSSARGTPTRATAVSTPPPAKKARTSPANASNTPSRGRGRGRKIDISEDSEEAKGLAEPPSAKSPEKSITSDKKQAAAEKSNNKVKEVSKPISEASSTAEKVGKSTENKEAEAVTSASNIEKSEDKKDAQCDLEEIDSEEKQNDNQHAPSKEAEEGAPVDKKDDETAMETDEPLTAVAPLKASKPTQAEKEPTKVESAPEETTLKSTEQSASLTVPKPLTLEPMDVDSNSKSSDLELIESEVPAAAEVSTETSAPVPDAPKNIAPPAETKRDQEAEIVEANATVEESAVKVNNIDNIDNSDDDILEVAPQAPAICEVGSVAANANALNVTNEVDTNVKAGADVEVAVAAEPAAAESEVNANNDESAKPGNDLCVPKVVSPSINNANNDETVTTIL